MNSKHVGVGISLGLCFGAALGTALHNLGWGSSAIGVGIALGVSLGTGLRGAGSGSVWLGGHPHRRNGRGKVVLRTTCPRSDGSLSGSTTQPK